MKECFMSDSKIFAVAGIVTDEKGRTKVRYCNDLVGRIKLFTKNTANKRVEFVELPNPMSKLDAIKYLSSHEKFQSSEDQVVLSDALSSYEPKSKKVTNVVKVKATKKKAPSLDSIKARVKKSTVTAEDILSVVVDTNSTVTQ
jgi:hypothetical protein